MKAKYIKEFNGLFGFTIKKHPGYYKLFYKFFIDKENFKGRQLAINYTRKLYNVYQVLIYNKHYISILPKLPIQYKVFDELYKDSKLIGIMDDMVWNIKDGYKFFPKELFKQLNIESKKKLLSIYADKKNKPIRKSETIIQVKKYCKILGTEYVDNTNEQFKLFKTKIKSFHNCEILYNKKKLIIMKVKKCSFFRQLSKVAWCLKYKNYWDDYIYNDNYSQYVVWDYNILPGHPNHRISFTTNSKNTVLYCFSDVNCPINKKIAQNYLIKIGIVKK